jgi:hypothetical protein
MRKGGINIPRPNLEFLVKIINITEITETAKSFFLRLLYYRVINIQMVTILVKKVFYVLLSSRLTLQSRGIVSRKNS